MGHAVARDNFRLGNCRVDPMLGRNQEPETDKELLISEDKKALEHLEVERMASLVADLEFDSSHQTCCYLAWAAAAHGATALQGWSIVRQRCCSSRDVALRGASSCSRLPASSGRKWARMGSCPRHPRLDVHLVEPDVLEGVEDDRLAVQTREESVVEVVRLEVLLVGSVVEDHLEDVRHGVIVQDCQDGR